QIVDSLRQFGFGSKTGIDCLPESSGKVPTAEKIKHSLNFEKALLSIGQGTLITTPIQIAVAVSSLFNGGLILKPRLIEEIFSSDRKIVYEMLNPIIISSYDYDEKLGDYITRAMFDVVNSPEGTALSSRSNVVSFGGKTGTAQVISLSRKSELPSENFEDHAWFVGYWPHPKPKYVIVVLVENGGSGGKVAAPIAKSFIEYVESS
ncbi:MAG: penicillin-binding transpeptidase domain-containing protein, partial [Deltaproteobacteria bacterium]|nr:penicillin-binding transpeptidase domain-containing protein [Deltaproteobacteria bacterium]